MPRKAIKDPNHPMIVKCSLRKYFANNENIGVRDTNKLATLN